MSKSRPAQKSKLLEYKEKIQKKADEIAENPHAAPGTLYFFKPLSPFHSYMHGYLTDDKTKKHGEIYHRSEHFPHKDKNTAKYYPGKAMKNGDRAHLGAYANNFERTGDSFHVEKNAEISLPITVQGDAVLYNAELHYKLFLCQSLADRVGQKDYIKVGFYNNYPCAMVYIKPASIHKTAENSYKPSDAAFEAWVNLLISIYVGHVNYLTKKKNLDIELVRRSSFGFLSPTIAVTGSSMRINMGAVPDTYVAILAEGLEQLNQMLTDLQNTQKIKNPLPKKCFYGTDTHKTYLADKYTTPELNDVFQLLWQQVEKGGKTTVQNMMRTSFCRDGISVKVYESLEKNAESLLAATTSGLEWALDRIVMLNGKLSFNNKGGLTYPLSAQKAVITKPIKDEMFWNFIRLAINVIKANFPDNTDIQALISEIENNAKNYIVSNIYKHFETLNELILLDVLTQQAALPTLSPEDGYGSDSDDEATFKDTTVYSNKLIVSNGMRAILATLLAIGSKLSNFSLYVDAADYEVEFGIKLLKTFEEKSITLREPGTMSSASVYLLDVNACVTKGVSAKNNFDTFISQAENKILVLDTTSATTDQMHTLVKSFSGTRASAMFFVSSGLKNEQLGADRNAYGTIRLFTKDKPLLKSYYKSIKSKEPAVDSPIAHEYRRTNKKLGAVPTIKSIFRL